MSPRPCRSRQGDVPVAPGINKTTAPGVHDAGQARLLPVDGSTQWLSFARSPLGGVPAAGSVFGNVEASGGRSQSGGAGWPGGQLLIVTLEVPFPVWVQKVSPLQEAFCAR